MSARLARPIGLDEDTVLFAEVSGRRCHDRALADYNFAVLLERLPNVVFADKVGGGLYCRRRC